MRSHLAPPRVCEQRAVALPAVFPGTRHSPYRANHTTPNHTTHKILPTNSRASPYRATSPSPTKSCRPDPCTPYRAAVPQNPATVARSILIGPQPHKTQDPRAHKQKGLVGALRAPYKPQKQEARFLPSYQLPACGELCATAISRASSSSRPAPALAAHTPPDARPSGSAEVNTCPSHAA